MKLRPEIKKSSLILATGLVLSLLILMTFSALVSRPERIAKINSFAQSIRLTLAGAVEKYKISAASPDGVNVENEIIKPLAEVRKKLETMHQGNDPELKSLISLSGEDRVTLKLAIIELEKAEGAVKAKAVPDFKSANSSIEEVLNKVTADSHTSLNRIKYISWLLTMVVFGMAFGLAFHEYKATRREQVHLNQAKTLLDEETRRVEKLSSFIEAISSGNYNSDLATDGQDELNTKLSQMRDKLKKNAEDDQQRNWASAGLAQAGEILRANTGSQVLYDTIIKFVVKYTQSNQGGLFIISEDERDKQLELAACYAFERKKFLTRKIEIGQGIIGQCFLEKEKIHLTQIPDDYVNITSGLGGANPKSLLLMPLKTNDEIFGVLELASFNAYQEYQVEWIARLAENIATTIGSVRTNESTRLLLERTQQQAEEMKAQEEEMRQNMEELSATQEEMARKEREYINRINELEAQVAVEAR